MREVESRIEIMDDNGELKSKEEFMSELEKLYDEVSEQVNGNSKEGTILDTLTNPENLIDVESSLETYEFLDRTIFITDEIDQAHANSVFEIIKFWNDVDEMEEIPVEQRQPIRIYINTPGGDLEATFTIISSIKISKTPVYTITTGTGYSGGFFIGICGHKKFGLPYSSYLFHEGSSMDGGDAHKFIQKAEFYKVQLNRLKEIVISNTKISNKMYEKIKKDDWFVDAEEALKYGVIDKIITDINDINEE